MLFSERQSTNFGERQKYVEGRKNGLNLFTPTREPPRMRSLTFALFATFFSFGSAKGEGGSVHTPLNPRVEVRSLCLLSVLYETQGGSFAGKKSNEHGKYE